MDDTLDVVNVFGQGNPCADNPFACGCPMQSASCNDIYETTDPSNNNENNSGDDDTTPGGTSYWVNTDPPTEPINVCEVAYAAINYNGSKKGKVLAERVTDLFSEKFNNEYEILFFLGGNDDDTPANALKHYIWNVLMVCDSQVGLEAAKIIAQNHEECAGVKYNGEARWQMDSHNNRKGQEAGVLIKANNKCNDLDHIIATALANKDILISAPKLYQH